MPYRSSVLALLLPLVVMDSGRAQVVLYVDKDASPGGDGFSWATAFDDLALPLEAAVLDIVFKVADGIYTPDSGTRIRQRSFKLKSTIRLEGGYGGISEADPNLRDVDFFSTVLSGDLAGNDGPNFANRTENS